MIALDSSVVVAGFSSWHEEHARARKVLDREPRLVAHAAIEAYSVLTRLPPPHRAPAEVVGDFLAARFRKPYLVLDPRGHRRFIEELPRNGIVGGQVYDALIAFTAAESEATLVTCDRRALDTYERLGVHVQLLTGV